MATVRRRLAALGTTAEEDVAVLFQLLDLPVDPEILAWLTLTDPRPRRSARHAPASGPLLPRPRHSVCYDGPAGKGSLPTVYCNRSIQRHGDDVLAAPGRGGAGAGLGAMTMGRILASQRPD
jgi:hypothetical protein